MANGRRCNKVCGKRNIRGLRLASILKNDTNPAGCGIVVITMPNSTTTCEEQIRRVIAHCNSVDVFMISATDTTIACGDVSDGIFEEALKAIDFDPMLIPFVDFQNKHIFGNIRGDFMVWAGKIVMHWNSYYGIWFFWQPINMLKKRTEIFRKNIHKWFSGCPLMNRGRHWDRKRRC